MKMAPLESTASVGQRNCLEATLVSIRRLQFASGSSSGAARQSASPCVSPPVLEVDSPLLVEVEAEVTVAPEVVVSPEDVASSPVTGPPVVVEAVLASPLLVEVEVEVDEASSVVAAVSLPVPTDMSTQFTNESVESVERVIRRIIVRQSYARSPA